jgi:hypothetical protein
MAESCRTCALQTLGSNTRDFADTSVPTDADVARFISVLREGCRKITVDDLDRRTGDTTEPDQGH